MRDTVYLVLNSKGIVAHRKGRPNLRAGEAAIRLTVELSDHFFRQSIPEAFLEVPDENVARPDIEVKLREVE